MSKTTLHFTASHHKPGESWSHGGFRTRQGAKRRAAILNAVASQGEIDWHVHGFTPDPFVDYCSNEVDLAEIAAEHRRAS